MNHRILFSIMALLAIGGTLQAEQPAYRPDAVLVRFADDPNITVKSAILNSALGGSGSSIKREYALVKGMTQVKLPPGVSVENAVASLKQSSSVLYAEPDYKLQLFKLPDDTRFSELWGMWNFGQTGGTMGADISAPEAWDISTGSKSIVVAVIDSGVDYTHVDLAANMWRDSNGNFGYDFGDNDSDPMDDSAEPSHGTHVAGTIGAVGNNALGVTGICWDANIIAVKIANSDGDLYVSSAVAGIEYAVDEGAKVINASWGSYEYSQPLYDAIVIARNAGVIFVAAAGNGFPWNSGNPNNNDLNPAYPASFDLDNIISVMATSDTDAQAFYSNYGLTSVDLGAPGGEWWVEYDPRSILSTVPGNQYEFYQGTSMAAPHVTGACALLLSINPSLTYSQVRQTLLNTVDPTLTGLCVSGGRLNLAAAAQEVEIDTTPPTPNPAEWDIQPQATGLHTVTMEAKEAADLSGVEYYFECVNDVNINSGWETGTLYSFTTLDTGTTYGFRFKVRDKSTNHNETGWSATIFTTTASSIDNLPPVPNPARWAIKPRMIQINPPRIRMQAKTAYDENGVEYWFEETTVTGITSGWQSSNIFDVTSGIDSGETYTFRCKSRDKAILHKETAWSESADVRTAPGTRILKVPAVYGNIQSAIDDAVDGDIVEVSPYPVSPYTYRGPGNRDIDFKGKAITVRSIDPMNAGIVASTVIDCEGASRAFTFRSGEDQNSILGGLTIRNGYVKGTHGADGEDGLPNDSDWLDGEDGEPGGDALGGAILCTATSNPTIHNCVIENCIVEGGDGGDGGNGAPGVDYDPGDPCATPPVPPTSGTTGGDGGDGGDSGWALGGAIFCDVGSSPLIQNCVIRNCRVLPGTPGNGGNGGDGGEAPGGGQMLGGCPGNGGSVSPTYGSGVGIILNNTRIIGCTIADCNAFNFAEPGQPGSPGEPAPSYCTASAGEYGFAVAGGIYEEMNSDTIISSTTISQGEVDSYLGGDGGGFYGVVIEGDITITMSDCNFTENIVSTYGGGMFLGGLSGAAGRLILRDCNIADNTATFDGGGMVSVNVDVETYDSTVTGNAAAYGGGMLLFDLALTVQDGNFLNNVAQEGGAVADINCSIDMSSCRITGNSAIMVPGSDLEGGLGGGLASWNSFGQITDCLMSFNSADAKGGAAFTEGWADSPLQFINCLITDNSVLNKDGGGLSCKTGAWTQLINCTIVNNSSANVTNGSGGGVSCAEDWALVEIINSILWDNFAAYGPQIGVGTRFGSFGDPSADVDVRYSDVEGGEDAVFLQDPDYTAVWWWPSSFDADPLFTSVAADEQAYYLSQVAAGQLVDSPCVDAGSADVNDPSINLGGYTTRTDSAPDMGIVDVGYHYAPAPALQYSLTIEVVNDVGGSLFAHGGGDNAFTIEDPNSRLVNAGTVVSLQAIADMGYGVLQWTGTDNDASIDPNNTVTMNSNKVVRVEFHQYQLTIEVMKEDGFGADGYLVAKGDGADPFTLQAREEPNSRAVTPGILVDLNAVPDANYKVLWWSGTDNDELTGPNNTVTMTSDKNVVVAFEPNGLYNLTVTVIGNGTVDPNGRTLRTPGEVVTLTATPDNPSDIILWTGTDNDNITTTTNVVTMTGHKAITVEFYTPRILYVGGDTGYPTIQAAIDDAHDGDIILLMPSPQPYYTQEGFEIIGRNITITSINPDDPAVVASTVIQQQTGPEASVRSAFQFYNVGPLMRLQGITIRGFSGTGRDGRDGDPQQEWGYNGEDGAGPVVARGILCYYNASPTIVNCVIDDCHSYGGNGGEGATGSSAEPPHINGGDGGWPGAAWGGGLTCINNSNPTLINCTFSNNTAIGGNGGDGGNGLDDPCGYGRGGHGGGWHYDDASPPTSTYTGVGGAVYVGAGCFPMFENCDFNNNFSSGGLNGICGQSPPFNGRAEPTVRYKIDNLGGAVYLAENSSAIFNGCTFVNNNADTNKLPDSFDGLVGFGGAVASDNNAMPIFIECQFTNNTSDVGGGVYSLRSDSEVNDSNFFANTASHGGGLLLSGGTAYVAGNLFSDNLASIPGSEGGAIGLLGINAEILDCDITNNRAGSSGGGIYVSSKNVDGNTIDSNNAVLVKNCLITNNVADIEGGGIAAAWHADVNIVNCTIVDNTVTIGGTDAGFGGGLYCSHNSYTNIINSIIWGNLGTAGAQLALITTEMAPSTANVSYSVIGPPRDVNVTTIEPAEALMVTTTDDANVLANTILGPGIELVGQPQYTGADIAAGTFVGGLAAGIDIESGIILTSGDANLAMPPNKGDGTTVDNNLPGDPDLDALLQTREVNAAEVNTYDAATFEFAFTTQGGDLFFNFVFASDEYNEWVNSTFNDVFGFFLDGVNIALIPGTTIPVAINNVNGGNPLGINASNSHLFHNNDPSDDGPFFDIEYDGFTSVFTAQAFNVGSGTHTIKLAIADTSDHALDSAVFIEAGSFSDKPSYSDPIYVDEGCILTGWDPNAPDPNDPWEPGTHNLGINADPLFIAGYYLSQIAAGQLINSPCWNAGSADVNSPGIDLAAYTTRTDSVTDVCTVDMGYHYTPAPVQQYSLTIEVNGVGGRLLAQSGGDNAFTIKDPNTLLIKANTVVSLQAIAETGYGVLRWTGTDDDASTELNNTVTMNSNKVVRVEFYQCHLTIEVMGADGFDPNGYLVATGDGIDPFTLYTRQEPNSRKVTPGTVVNLEAFPDENFKVMVWTGTDDDASTALTNTVTMNSDKTVVVGFEPDGLYYLTVTVIGNGTVTPAGRSLRTPGEVVTLTATPDNPSDAIIWTGTNDDNSAARQNTVTMTGHKEITVNFYAPRVLYVGSDSNYPTIQLAIADANDRDIVMVTPGVYNIYESSEDRPYLYISGKDIKLTSTNPEDANATQIVGGFVIENVSRNLIIEGFTIRDALYWKDYERGNTIIGEQTSTEWHWDPAPQGTGVDGYGGGTCRGAGMQLNDTASPTVRNCRFVNCVARGWHGQTGAGGTGDDGWSGNGGPGGKAFGGGAYCGQGGSPLFENCSFINCSAQGGDGGNGGSGSPATGGHGGGWGDNDAVWWNEWKQLYGVYHPLEEYWKYSGYGGAIYCDVNNTAEFVNCTFTGNSTIGGSCGISGAIVPSGWPTQHYKIESFGGAVYAAAGSSPLFAECVFTDNEANMQGPPTSRKDNTETVNAYPNISYGGAVAFEDGATPVFEGCTFNDNRATVGGGAFATWSYGTITDCNFEDNSSYHGGGILFVGGTSDIVNSRFTGNRSAVSAAQGGAITLLGGDAEVNDCNIWNNDSAGSGGGIYISSRDVYGTELAGGNSVLISNCLITENSAGQNGAGISSNWHSDTNIVNCTIVDNIADQGMGGGLYSAYNNYTHVINSILWNNTAPRGPQIAVGTASNPAYVKVTYSDVQGGIVDVYLAPSTVLEWDTAKDNPYYPTNIHIDPLFTPGPKGDFYLSQTDSGQAQTSPCVNTGGNLANDLGFMYYTTRTDEIPDRATVDMGYHYPLREPCRFSDLLKDGIINFFDLAIIADSWLNEGCTDANQWCGGADLTFDTRVGLDDLVLVTNCWLAWDSLPPLPNPSQWEIEPFIGDDNSVTMRAVETQDVLWGLDVEYYFKCESGDCNDSGWQTDQNYVEVNLTPSAEYGYKVKARDTAGNETDWSVTRYVTTGTTPGAETNPPTPDPMTWAVQPYAVSTTSVAMVATTATDDSGIVYYQFAETNGITSGWQTDPCYVATGLDPNEQHCYRVRARDKYNNMTGWSGEVCVGNLGDSIPPSPAPEIVFSPTVKTVSADVNTYSGQFQTNGFDWWHKVVVDVADITDDVDGTHVEIRFICSDNSFSSTSKVPVPIYIDGSAMGGLTTNDWRVTYDGDTIVYDADVDQWGGTGQRYDWTACVYDASLNSACSASHEIGP